jgi:hypothetical protein
MEVLVHDGLQVAAVAVLERAVGTTFTLHLTALLPIPLGLAGADLSRTTDPLGVLQAVRNYSDRIDVFCQAGHVSVPLQRNDLLAFVEPMVHQVKAPRPGHLFHPKIWVLRYTNDYDGEECFRLVCGSRNLTHDRAWDVVINLDGRRTLQRRAVNRPIAEFLTSLSARVPAGMPVERSDAIDDLAEALRFVEWERPDGAVADNDWLTFHIFGRGRRTRPNMDGYRRLVVSPFLNDAGLDAAWPDGSGDCTVVSRAEEFDAVGEGWRAWLTGHADLRVLDEAAAIPDSESDEAGLRWSLSGLHAKLYVIERAKAAHVFIGSANTTDAAWGGNDELLIEIVGKVGTFGVQATIGAEGSGFGRLLLPHAFGEPRAADPDEELQRTLENALRELAALTFTATVEGENEHPLLWVRSDETVRYPESLPDPKLTIELLTLTAQPRQLSRGARADQRWQLSQVEEVTPFLILRLAVGTRPARLEVSSVVLARLVGDPPDRLDRVLARRIGTPTEFLRFVLLLLQLAGREGWSPDGVAGGAFASFVMGDAATGLLEEVLRALTSSPGAIDDIDRLVKRLSATEKGRQVLPEGWNDFWPAVVEARAHLGAGT